MMKVQILIVFLIFNISNCRCRYSLEEAESVVEFGLYRKILYEYLADLSGVSSCWKMIAESSHSTYHVRPIPGADICRGRLTTCSWAGDVTMCKSVLGDLKIQWIDERRSGAQLTWPLRHSRSCPKESALELYQTDSLHSVCQCVCVQPNWGVHLGLIQSRENDNYIIIGIRFIVRANVLYLQPAEGKLEADRKVSGFSWIYLPNDPSELHRVDEDSANFFLHDLILDEGYALTGVKFEYMEVAKPKMVKGFGINGSGRPFFNSGHLVWVTGRESTIRSPMNPEHVKLQRSKLEVDYAQSTTPLFHNERLEKRHQLLSGFGIFLETSNTNDTFISLRTHKAL